MQLTQVTVSYGLTESLPGYNNIKPAISLTADLEAGEDETQVIEAIFRMIRHQVEQRVDEALEAAGEAPKFYDGPRFNVWRVCEFIVIAPSGSPPAGWPTEETQALYHGDGWDYENIYRGRRLGPARELARRYCAENQNEADRYQLQIVEALDGALSDEVLIALRHLRVTSARRYSPARRSASGMIAAGSVPNVMQPRR